ncbi:hypothetical protein GCM10010503_07150 [Streptomyces lucensis JCM 4490]|uniref:Lipoprotein n=1 Tax=Streptomyces lucensis JCM 4490 TaxID=1306176 RepID=A0A918IUX8_9ACTN|nr:hypothetical protein [Streptomyces lucensis]GGW33680.1 hypothetical protein GCM10010503_07150 [Streptomyces lucensis JCM 4490]
MKRQKFTHRAVPLAMATLFALTGCSGSGGSGKTETRTDPVTGPVTVSRDGSVLTVTADWGGCDEAPRLRASETSTTVSLTVRVTTRTGRGVVCPADARSGPARVTLREALGSRTVTDGTTGRRLPHGKA